MAEKKQIMVQIPDEIVQNKWFKLDAYSFAAYGVLKHTHFRSQKENKEELEIDHNKMKHKLCISDNRTLKKIFETLHKNQIVLELVQRFPRKGGMSFTFNPSPNESESFTQLPVTVFNKIEHIGAIGVQLLFYYESFINRKIKNRNYAFPAIETISNDLGLNHTTVIKYNEILKKHKLIKIVKHELEENGYNDDLSVSFVRFNNHYFVQIDNM